MPVQKATNLAQTKTLSSTGYKKKVVLTSHNEYNLGYSAEIYLGSESNPQKIRAMFDTGSANAWILSSKAAEKMEI